MQACDFAVDGPGLAAEAAGPALAAVVPSTPAVTIATITTSHCHGRPRIIARLRSVGRCAPQARPYVRFRGALSRSNPEFRPEPTAKLVVMPLFVDPC